MNASYELGLKYFIDLCTFKVRSLDRDCVYLIKSWNESCIQGSELNN